MPGLPMFPFVTLAAAHGRARLHHPAAARAAASPRPKPSKKQDAANKADEEKNSVKASLATAEIELLIGKQLSTKLLVSHQELAFRMGKMRKKFATQYGFVVPEVRLTDDFAIPSKSYQIKVHGTVVAEHADARRRDHGAARQPRQRRTSRARKCASRPSACAPGRCRRCSPRI